MLELPNFHHTFALGCRLLVGSARMLLFVIIAMELGSFLTELGFSLLIKAPLETGGAEA